MVLAMEDGHADGARADPTDRICMDSTGIEGLVPFNDGPVSSRRLKAGQ